MNARRFDELLAGLGRTPTRRRVFAVLGGAALGGFVSRDGATKAARQKHNHQRQPPKTCRPGQRVGVVLVPATGDSVRTPVLLKGEVYRLRAIGAWKTNAQTGNDAVAAFPFDDPSSPTFTFQGVRLGLSIDGGSPDVWGDYTTNHVYEIAMNGRGRPLSLHFTDPVTSDNSLNVAVEVTCLGKVVRSDRQRRPAGSAPAPSAESANAMPAAGRRT